MSKIVFDEPAWWRRPGWQGIMAALLAVAAWAVWWTALTPVDHDPIVVRTPPAPTVVARSVAPPAAAPVVPAGPPVVAPPAVPDPSPVPAAPPLSRVAPGVRVTPLSLPPDMSAPAETQTEENLEN